ncbi:MAG: signal peptidase II [Desulfobacula sp. RIFOXYA12_FULL_46_16]|nr:MAG: signal peptidase II [Deltaproteobacteria bacterium RIFOXYC2_FULL_48_10]OGR20296.1 MAG: signal peptidase II [Desulfobacula sp. RIFOXYA12_FULL_46_16]OGR49588.1 MAG: signal peptidase II [Desulfobacula sp. RIFOXYB2_FULL_45_6]
MWTGLKSNAWIRLALVSGSIIIVDQVTKYILKINLALHDHIVILDNFFNITHVLNPGGAFGFFAEKSPEIRKFIFLFLSSLVALFVLWFYKKCAETYIFLSYGLALIFGGAIGNLIDRFLYGKVVDFLDFYIGSAHWPAFNIADSAISVGMGILIGHILFNKIPDI